MKLHLKDGTEIEVNVSPVLLYDIYTLASSAVIDVTLPIIRRGQERRVNLIDALDFDRTFENVIRGNFPTAPPDTVEDFEGEYPPISRISTMPCRE